MIGISCSALAPARSRTPTAFESEQEPGQKQEIQLLSRQKQGEPSHATSLLASTHACSPAEQAIITRIKRAKLFIFLRDHRYKLFDDAFQEELAALYTLSRCGHPPIPPAQLALATILQAYTGVSDDEVIEATLMDRRWQLALDCLDCEQAPFSKGTLVAFRQRLIARQMDRRLIERTIEIASQNQAFGPRALRAALDSSPLWGAGRVEDTLNLMGHALKKVMRVIADQQGS